MNANPMIAEDIWAVIVATQPVDTFLQILLDEIEKTNGDFLYWETLRKVVVSLLDQSLTPAQRVKAMKVLAAIAKKGNSESIALLLSYERSDMDISVRTTCTYLLIEIQKTPDGFEEDKD